jgi:hypothetical protein
MPTYIVKVSDQLIYDRCATLLITADNDEQAEELARQRCINDSDIEWDESQSDASPYEVEVDTSEEAEELGELIHDNRHRPAGLDYDEEQRRQELTSKYKVHWREARRFEE